MKEYLGEIWEAKTAKKENAFILEIRFEAQNDETAKEFMREVTKTEEGIGYLLSKKILFFFVKFTGEIMDK